MAVTGRDLSPRGFVPKQPRSGDYTAQYPTRYFFRSDVADLIERAYARFGRDRIHVTTYWRHSPGFEAPTRSLDVWDAKGRGFALPYDIGRAVFDFFFNDPNPPHIEYIIYRRRLYAAWNGWRGEAFGTDPFSYHDDHIHITFTGPEATVPEAPRPAPKPRPQPKPKPRPEPKKPRRRYGKEDPIWGIDVSNHQGAAFPFAQAKREGYDFAFVMATEGPYPDHPKFTNPLYHQQVADAREAGMTVGAYHFLIRGNAEAQAAHFLDTIGPVDDLMVAIDFEAYNPPYAHYSADNDTLKRFVSALRRRLGPDKPLVVYSGKGYWEGGTPSGPLSRYGQNLVTWDAYWPLGERADLGSRLYFDAYDHGWGRRWGGVEPMFWQFASTGLVAGMPIDVNAFRGTPQELTALARGAARPVDPPEPEPEDETRALWVTLETHDKRLHALEASKKEAPAVACPCQTSTTPPEEFSRQTRRRQAPAVDPPNKALVAAIGLLALSVQEIVDTGTLSAQSIELLVASVLVPALVYITSNARNPQA